MSEGRPSASLLAEGEFKRERLRGLERRHVLDEFSGWIEDVLTIINDGKEATVYLCQAVPATGFELLAAKVYRARKFRAFRNDASYYVARRVRDQRQQRAMRSRSRFGRIFAHDAWVQSEWQTLKGLHEVGADVPVPLACSGDAILMQYLGDHRGAAPMLVHATLPPEAVRPAFEGVLRNVELMLGHDLIHGDLSAYNVLYWQGSAFLIDLPQVVDTRTAADPFSLLVRDLANICRHFERYGLATDQVALAEDLWTRYQLCQL